MPKKKPGSKLSACILTFHVVPRSSRCSITLLKPGEYRAKLTSPPVDGAANDQLVALIAKILRTSKRDVEIISGSTSRTKRIQVHGLSAQEAENFLKG